MMDKPPSFSELEKIESQQNNRGKYVLVVNFVVVLGFGFLALVGLCLAAWLALDAKSLPDPGSWLSKQLAESAKEPAAVGIVHVATGHHTTDGELQRLAQRLKERLPQQRVRQLGAVVAQRLSLERARQERCQTVLQLSLATTSSSPVGEERTYSLAWHDTIREELLAMDEVTVEKPFASAMSAELFQQVAQALQEKVSSWQKETRDDEGLVWAYGKGPTREEALREAQIRCLRESVTVLAPGQSLQQVLQTLLQDSRLLEVKKDTIKRQADGHFTGMALCRIDYPKLKQQFLSAAEVQKLFQNQRISVLYDPQKEGKEKQMLSTVAACFRGVLKDRGFHLVDPGMLLTQYQELKKAFAVGLPEHLEKVFAQHQTPFFVVVECQPVEDRFQVSVEVKSQYGVFLDTFFAKLSVNKTMPLVEAAEELARQQLGPRLLTGLAREISTYHDGFPYKVEWLHFSGSDQSTLQGAVQDLPGMAVVSHLKQSNDLWEMEIRYQGADPKLALAPLLAQQKLFGEWSRLGNWLVCVKQPSFLGHSLQFWWHLFLFFAGLVVLFLAVWMILRKKFRRPQTVRG